MKIATKIIFLLCSILLLAACKKEPKVIDGIQLNQSSITLQKGEKKALQATTTPVGVQAEIEWKALDPSIASVTENGTVEGLKRGSTVVTANVKGTQIQASCLVSVTDPDAPDDYIVELNKSSTIMRVGDEQQLRAKVTPENPPVELEWKSQDPNIVAVDANGKITAKAVGTTLVTAQVSGSDASAACLVEVKEKISDLELTAEIEHSLSNGYSLIIKVAMQGANKIYIDNGNGTAVEQTVSTDPTAPTMVDIRVEGSLVKLYGGSMSYFSLVSTPKIKKALIHKRDKLRYLDLSGNDMEAFDFSNLPVLQYLNVNNNNIKNELTLSLPELQTLKFAHNGRSGLTLNCPKLTTLELNNQSITSFSATGLNALRTLSIHKNQLKSAALATLIASLPTVAEGNGKCVLLNTQDATSEGNEPDLATLLPAATAKGWKLLDGKTELSLPVVDEDPAGFDMKDAAYLDWNNGTREAIAGWELARGNTFDASASDTEAPEEYLLLVFKGKSGSDVVKRVYIIEENEFLQVELFVAPLEKVLVPEQGAQLRLNKNLLKSLKENGYSNPTNAGANVFRCANSALKSSLMINKEVTGGKECGKLLFSPKK